MVDIDLNEHLRAHIEGVSNTYFVHNKNIVLACDKLVKCFKGGGKVLLFGNGGSYSDALHFAGELEGRYKMDRPALPAIVPNPVSITAIGNDYGYELTFQRFVEANATKKDVLIAISTSGKSKNVINAVKAGKARGAYSIGFTGETGGDLKGLVDLLINVQSTDTPRIQEAHLFLYHSISHIIEEEMFGKK